MGTPPHPRRVRFLLCPKKTPPKCFFSGWFESNKTMNKSKMHRGRRNVKSRTLSISSLWLHPIPKAPLIPRCPQIPKPEQGLRAFFALTLLALPRPSSPSSPQGFFFFWLVLTLSFSFSWGLSSGCQEQRVEAGIRGENTKVALGVLHSLSDHTNSKQIKFDA